MQVWSILRLPVTPLIPICYTVRIISFARHARTIATGKAFAHCRPTMERETGGSEISMGWGKDFRWLPSTGVLATSFLSLIRILSLLGALLLLFSVAATACAPKNFLGREGRFAGFEPRDNGACKVLTQPQMRNRSSLIRLEQDRPRLRDADRR